MIVKVKVQLIDGSSFSTSMRKNLGNKGKEINEKQINNYLKYTKIIKRMNTVKFIPIVFLDTLR